MSITPQQFEYIASLAYLDVEDVKAQYQRCCATMQDIELLQRVDTLHISPMHHPTSVTQYLRPDQHVVLPDIQDLEHSAPDFVDHLYQVPLIIKGA